LLRELCLDRNHDIHLKVGYLAMIDPIVFGGASAGLVGVINAQVAYYKDLTENK
jgi:hypothetical protein